MEMSTLINYFEIESPKKSPHLQSKTNDLTRELSILNETANLETKEKHFILNNKTKNQEIVKNMEEVLSLVKKKHKNKHKHDVGKRSKHHKHHRMKSLDNSQKSPLKENTVNSNKKNKKHRKTSKDVPVLLSPEITTEINDASSQKSSIDNNNTLKVCIVSEESQTEVISSSDERELKGKTLVKEKVNAFEFLMNARSKVIGVNSPGKEDLTNNNSDKETEKSRVVNAKRKLLLQEWSNAKGAKKRKLDEVARDQFIENQMERRAKRLKELIEGSPSKKEISSKSTKSFEVEKVVKKTKTNLKKNEKISQSMETKIDSKPKNLVRRSVRNSEKLTKQDVKNVSPDNNSLNITKPDEFGNNLSSPLKKRDSLYGYFEKTTPSSSEKETSKRKSVTNENKEMKSDSKTNLNANINFESTPTSSGRPRRSCVGKTRYDINDYDLNLSPEKTRLNRNKNKLKNSTGEGEDIIMLDNTSSPIIEIYDCEKKLAPLFVPKSKANINTEKLKARQEFLMSGIPEKMKIEIAKIKQFQDNYIEYNYFPKYNHVPLYPSYENDFDPVNWQENGIFWRNDKNLENNAENINTIKYKNLKKLLEVSEKPLVLPPLVKLKPLENKRLLVKEWKALYDRFPTYKCYNQLREKYRYFSAMDTAIDTHEVTDSVVVSTQRTRKVIISDSQKDCLVLDNIKPPLSAPNGELLFFDKYKPLVSEQILVNLTPVNQLKDFLSNWQCKSKVQRSDESIDSSFECPNDSNSALGTSNSVVVVGPTSSGKTNAVFALANELNFNVLEINAGMKRSGKKLLQDLQEATQSHQIPKDSKNPNKLLKKSLNSFRKKHKDNPSNENSLSSDIEQNTKLSLILVEDADIVFDNFDQGFVEAIYQLVGTSKRPVVILANDKKCLHLQKLINQNCIEFEHPNGVNISKFLTILSLMENCPIHLDDVVSLYYFNKMDLRKTISEIQFFVQSGGDRILINKGSTELNQNSPSKTFFASPSKNKMQYEYSVNGQPDDDVKVENQCLDNNIQTSNEEEFYIHKQLFEFFTVSQNFLFKIPYPMNFDLLWINMNEIFKVSILFNDHLKCENQNKNAIQSLKHTETLSDFYEMLSLASNIGTHGENCCLVNYIENEISHFMVEESVSSLMQIDELSYNLFDERSSRVDNLSSIILPTISQRNKKSIALDIEPTLRSICRSEKSKLNQKRIGSRHYHYLRNISSNMKSFSFELFDDVCPVFVDDPTNFIELNQPKQKVNDWLD